MMESSVKRHYSVQAVRKSVNAMGSVVYSGAVDAKTRVRQRIKRLLEDRGKTQHQLAGFLGHSDQWASNLLAGRHALSWDLMFSGRQANDCDNNPSPRERHHAALAYARPVGSRDVDVDPSGLSSLAPGRIVID